MRKLRNALCLLCPTNWTALNRRDEGYSSDVRRDDGGVFCPRLFDIARCDGLPHNEPVPELPEPERDARAEAFFDAIGSEVKWGESKAAYIPSKDIIVMPHRQDFTTPEGLYAVRAHEEIHRTGHKSRLNRDLKSRFAQKEYAEIGAAMTCAYLEVKGELRHAGYVQHWLEILKGDSKAILTAASLASKATDYLRAFSEPVVQLEAALNS